MLTVLIVDDEEKICWLIQKLIDWEQLDLQLIGTATDGKSALAIIKQQRPDIVITDVRMPDMDGLSMIRATLDANIQTTFIVVSGHRQFEYAYSALKYGVEDYLLKPIKRKELHSILQKITGRIRQERAFSQEKAQPQHSSSQKNTLRRQFIRELYELPIFRESLETINENFGLSFVPGVYYAIAAKVDVSLNCVGQVKTDFVCERIMDMMQEFFSSEFYELCCAANESTVSAVLNTQSLAPHDTLRELLGQLHMYADTFECYHISLSVSDAVSEIRELPSAMRQAQALLGNRLFQGNRQLLLSSSRPLVSEESGEELFPTPSRQQMRREIEAAQISAFRSLVLQQFSRLDHRQSCAAAAYYRLARLISSFVFQIVSENAWAEQDVKKEKALLELHIQNAFHQTDLANLLAERLGALLIQCEEQRKHSNSRPIRIAKQYIATHYGDNLTLEYVAKEAGLSSAYFSMLFKREVGVSFSDYLVEVRIKAAKELLEQTDETVACISDQVGYRDVKYFSRLFLRVVGVNPSKYRRLHS